MSVKTRALSEKLSRVARAAPISAAKTATVKQALALMREHKTHCLMICEGGRLAGIFTERDALMKVEGRARGDEPVSAYMTANPITARLDDTVGSVVEVMEAKGLRQLPIVDKDGAPASVVTVGAIIRYLAENFPAAVVNRPPQPHAKAAEADGA